MKLTKCPRCDLNYIREGEKYCKVCLREVKGESVPEEVELCSICNEAPVLPGKDVCFFCLKEMDERKGTDTENEGIENIDSLAGVDAGPLDEIDQEMDEMLPGIVDEIEDDQEMDKMEEQLSLETVQEDEEKEADEDADEEEF